MSDPLNIAYIIFGSQEALWPSGSVGLWSDRSGVLSSIRLPYYVLEQDTFTTQKYW